MTAASDLAVIAAKISPAVRRAVLAGGPKYGRGYWPLIHSMVSYGLVTSAGMRYVLSPLGNRLRLYLQEAQA